MRFYNDTIIFISIEMTTGQPQIAQIFYLLVGREVGARPQSLLGGRFVVIFIQKFLFLCFFSANVFHASCLRRHMFPHIPCIGSLLSQCREMEEFSLFWALSSCREMSDAVSLSDLGSSCQGCFAERIGSSLKRFSSILLSSVSAPLNKAQSRSERNVA